MATPNPPEREIVVTHTFADQPLFRQAKAIRQRVFIDEQSVPEADEWDEEDEVATHIVVFADRKPVGTARFYPENGWLKIGRVAVLPEYRGLGLGNALLSYCLEQGKALGYSRSFLNAQSDKLAFYQKHGYAPMGAEFDEAGIPHMRMERDLDTV